VLLWFNLKDITADTCPQPEILYPCKCLTAGSKATIECADGTYDIIKIFAAVAKNAIDVEHKQFDSFILTKEVKEINANTFHDLKFRSIYIKNVDLIHDFAFNGSDSLEYLELCCNVSHISKNALKINNNLSEVKLKVINLTSNHLNSESFEIDSISNITKQPLEIILSHNKDISHINANSFGPFFAANSLNSIDLSSNNIHCNDCNNFWLIREKDKYKFNSDRVKNIHCSDNKKSFWDITLAEFKTHCKCPASDILDPCICEMDNNDLLNIKNGILLTCFDYFTYNLNDRIKNMSRDLMKDEKHFNKIGLTALKFDVLEENSFIDITFDSLVLMNDIKLTKIHNKAFHGSEKLLREFYYSGGELRIDSPNYDFWTLIKSLENLEYLSIYECHINTIPDNAFSNNKNLKEVFFEGLHTLGQNLFSVPNNLERLWFCCGLTHIGKNTFNFENNSNKSLKIDLHANHLNSDSFENGAFNRINRSTILEIDYDQNITYLEHDVFAPFLSSRDDNKINVYFGEYNFDCYNCNNSWLIKDKLKFKSIEERIELHCVNNTNFWSLKETDFHKC
jgi:hypothetical protein